MPAVRSQHIHRSMSGSFAIGSSEQARMRLFCFLVCRGRSVCFPIMVGCSCRQEVEVCGIQLPGREDRLGEQAYTRLAPLVQALADAIYPYLDKPFAFYGHSMGSLISFELARQLRRTMTDIRSAYILQRFVPLSFLIQILKFIIFPQKCSK